MPNVVSSSGCLHPGAHGVVVLDPGLALGRARRVDRPRADGRDRRRATFAGPSPPASITRPGCGRARVEVGRVVGPPRAGRRPCRPARRAAQHAVARAVAVLALRRTGRGRRRSRAPRRRRPRRGAPSSGASSSSSVRRGLSCARMKPTRSAPASTAASTSSWRVSPQTLTSGREISSASFAPGSGARISVEPTSIAFAPASSAAAPWARVAIAGLGDHDPVARRAARAARAAPRGRSRRSRGRGR